MAAGEYGYQQISYRRLLADDDMVDLLFQLQRTGAPVAEGLLACHS